MAVSLRTRNEVWQGYVDAERLHRYYTRLASRYILYRRALQFTLGFAAVGGLSRFIGVLPQDAGWVEAVPEAASLLILVAVVLEFMGDYATKAALLNAIAVKCADLEAQWRELWGSVDSADADEAAILKTFRSLENDILNTTSVAGYAGIRENEKLNEAAMAETREVLIQRYSMEGHADNG